MRTGAPRRDTPTPTSGTATVVCALVSAALAWALMGSSCGNELPCREDVDCARFADEDHMSLCVVDTWDGYEPTRCVAAGVVRCEADDDCVPPYVCFDGTCGLGPECTCLDDTCIDEVCEPIGLVCGGPCVDLQFECWRCERPAGEGGS